MKWLVLLHVLTAIIGVGPTYFLHVLYRTRQSAGEFKHALRLGSLLDLFPKAGGSLSVISGIILVAWSPVRFLDLWIIGSLLLYAMIQVVIIGIVTPKQKQLRAILEQREGLQDKDMLPGDIQANIASINSWLYLVSAMGIVLFILMIVKPVL